MKSLAIILARGGSKRIPMKNIKDFCGKPIIAYSIEAALNCNAFDEVMVSTDNREIAQIASNYGAKIPFMRSPKAADDYATTAMAIIDVLNMYKASGKQFNYACCIYPTAPLIKPHNLAAALQKLINNNYNSVIPIVRFSFPTQRAFVLQNNQIQYKYPQYEASRSQDLEPHYHDCGQFYAFDVDWFMETKSLVGTNSSFIELPPLEVQDIDTIDDWQIAELKYQLRQRKLHNHE